MDIVKLKTLAINDRFCHAKNKDKRFKVIGKPEYNRAHGSATRICYDYAAQTFVSKSCRLDVIKLPVKNNV